MSVTTIPASKVEKDDRRELFQQRDLLKEIIGQQQCANANGVFPVNAIAYEAEVTGVDKKFRPAPSAADVCKSLRTTRPHYYAYEFNPGTFEAHSSDPIQQNPHCFSQLLKQAQEQLESARTEARSFEVDLLQCSLCPSITVEQLVDGEPLFTEHVPRFSQIFDWYLHNHGNFEVGFRSKDRQRIRFPGGPRGGGSATSWQSNIGYAPELLGLAMNWHAAYAFLPRASGQTSKYVANQVFDRHIRPLLWILSMSGRGRTKLAPYDIGKYYDNESLDAVLEFVDFSLGLDEIIPYDPSTQKSAGGDGRIDRVRHVCGYRWVTVGRPRFNLFADELIAWFESRCEDKMLTLVDDVAGMFFMVGFVVSKMLGAEDPKTDAPRLVARKNFKAVCRDGLDALITDSRGKMPSREFILKYALEASRIGHQALKTDSGEVDYFLGIVEKSVRESRTADLVMDKLYKAIVAKYSRGSLTHHQILVAELLERQQDLNVPACDWDLSLR